MLTDSNFAGNSELGYEEWIAIMHSVMLYSPGGTAPKDFTGRMRFRNVCGFSVAEHCNNAARVERTHKDVRLDGKDHYFAIFQLTGESVISQNDQVVKLASGDVVLIDAGRPATFTHEGRRQLLGLRLPRRTLISHLAYEPQGGLRGRVEPRARRLLYEIFLDTTEGENSTSASSDAYIRLAVYDLLGALFARERPFSSRTDKLFGRICSIIKDHHADPAFGPHEVAVEARISLSYLQKLFGARGLTCNRFIYSTRLDNAARLLIRRKLLSSGQPLSEIALACGFIDYNHFARKFRSRFGCTPSDYGVDKGGHPLRPDRKAATASL